VPWIGLVLAASIYRSVMQPGWHLVTLLHGILCLAAIGAFMLRRYLPVPLLFSIILAFVYVAAVQSLWSLGLAGPGMLHLIMFCTLAGTLLGIKAGVITLIIGMSTAVFFGIGFHINMISVRPGATDYMMTPSNWIIYVLCYLMYMTLLIFAVGQLRKKTVMTMKELESINIRLENEISMRRTAEEELRESEARLRQIIDTIPNHIYVKDHMGRFVIVNKSMADFWRMDIEEILGKSFSEIITENYRAERFIRHDGLVIESGKPRSIAQIKVSNNKGAERCFQVTKIPFVINSTGDKAILGVATDITERKKAEDEARESMRRFRELADMLPQAVAEFDTMGNFTYGNMNGLELFGLTKNEFEERKYNFSEMFVAQDLERLMKNVQRVLKGEKKPHDNEYTALRKDGATFPVMLYAVPIVREGRVEGMRAIAVDITERKNIEKALAESEEKYRSVVESSLIGFYIFQDGLFRFVNKRLCEITGYTYDEIVGVKNTLDAVHPDDRVRIEENIKNRLRGESKLGEYDFRIIRKDGKVVTIKVSGALISYHGKPAVSGTCIDVTRENALEVQLRQAQKMEAIGQLSGGIAHDFNNILTAINGYAGLLRIKMNRNDLLQTHIDQIMSATRKGSDLTRSLLTFSRRQPVNLRTVNLNSIIRGTEPLLKRLLAENVTLLTNLTSDNATVMADPTQMDQILLNLVSNANDAMPEGGTITIETKMAELDNDFVLIHGFGEVGIYMLLSVADTGRGMNKMTMEKIFEPFFTTKEAGKGTGLGLSTVYGIVKQHKGYIAIYSEEHIGTIFHIYLPLEKMGVNGERVAETSLRRGKETVLIAGDNRESLLFIKNVLELYGYVVIEAVDSEDAVRKFRMSKSIDLVVLDSMLPIKNSREIYEQIIAANPEMKVLFLGDIAMDAGFNGSADHKRLSSIAKPLVPRDILHKVRQMLST